MRSFPFFLTEDWDAFLFRGVWFKKYLQMKLLLKMKVCPLKPKPYIKKPIGLLPIGCITKFCLYRAQKGFNGIP